MNHLTRFCIWLLLGAAYLNFVGCNSSPPKPAPNAAKHDDHEHGHEEHPDTYAEAVARIDELRTEIKDALAKNDTKTADKPLHEVGELLLEGDIAGLAKKASLDEAPQAEIKQAVSQLVDSFDAIDQKVHDPSKGATYEEMSDKIDAALATLRQHVPGNK